MNLNPVVFALRRPITIAVAVVCVALGCALAVQEMDVDVFPRLNLPVIYVAQPYGGMDPAQMEGLITNYYEYHFLYISGIHHVESQNVQGMALMRLHFHPGTDMAQAMAETINYVNRSQAFMPPGTVSPFVMRFDTGSVPVGYLVLSSETRSLAEIQDLALFRVRPMFASLPGVSAPPPFGGNPRAIVVDVDPDRLRAYHLSPDDVVKALSTGNVVSPSGNIPLGDKYPVVPLNSMVRDISDLGTIPLRLGELPAVYLRDVAAVRDDTDIPVNYALVNGRRAIYLLCTKRADASTVSVVRNVKAAIPKMQAMLPDDIHVRFEFDQTPYVTRAVRGLAREGALGAVLTGLMVLVFLRDWRSVLVVLLNIPLALMGALVGLWLTGNSVNLMTLGGLALAVGILVDEATVEVENIHTQMAHTSDIARAVRLGNAQTAVPRLLAMLCVLAVFIPSFFMQGAARALFVPLALAVGFSMLASYLLSSTFVPVASVWLLRHVPRHEGKHAPGFFGRLRRAYQGSLEVLAPFRVPLVLAYLVAAGVTVYYVGGHLGREIFPFVDRGEFRLRLYAPDGTRYERTEQYALQVLQTIEEVAGKENVELTLGYVGSIPSAYPVNAVFQWSRGPEEGILRVALRPGSGIKVESLKEKLRGLLRERLSELRFSFEPADIVNEVMSFGSPTPVEVAVSGPNLAESRAFSEKLYRELADIVSLRDLRVAQSLDYPTVNVRLDREKAGISHLTTADMARSLVAATSSSRFVVPNFWPDPKTGIGYQVQVQIPQSIMKSVEELTTLPVGRLGRADAPDQTPGKQLLLRDVAEVTQATMPGEYDRYNMRRQVSLLANIHGQDLGSVAQQVSQAIERAGEPPKGAAVEVRGQIPPLRQVQRGLAVGFIMSIVVIFLLLTANYQSWRLALVAVSTAPAVAAGVSLALFLTNTTLNLQSFIGAIMAIGVAMANGILLVTFAEESRRQAGDAVRAGIFGGASRLRPILMTSMAMTAGMAPMALGLGEGGEQSAALGRAVIGGLLAATLATLFVLPSVFAVIQRRAGTASVSLDPDDPESPHFSAPDPGRFAKDIPPAIHIGALMLVCTLFGCEQAGPPHASISNSPATVMRLTTVRPRRKTVRRTVRQPGQIDAFQRAPLYAKVPGYARRYLVDIGDAVEGPRYDKAGGLMERGQLLAEVAIPELDEELGQKRALLEEAKAEVAQARAAVKVARAALRPAQEQIEQALANQEHANADYEKWQSEYHRVVKLAETQAINTKLVDEEREALRKSDAGRRHAASRKEAALAAVEQTEAAIEKAEADEAAALARQEVARADLARVAAMADYQRIEAPFDGTVSERNVDVGHFVQPAETAHARPLFTIVQTDVVRIFVDVPEADAPLVDRGDLAVLTVPSLQSKEFSGSVTRTAWVLDPRTRTLRTEVDVPNESGELRPGMYAVATVTLAESPDTLVVPATAVIAEDGESHCFCLVNDKLVKKTVELGLKSGTDVEVTSGLTSDDLVVEKATAELKEGQPAEANQVTE